MSTAVNAAVRSVTVREISLKRFHHDGEGSEMRFSPKRLNVSKMKLSTEDNFFWDSKARGRLSLKNSPAVGQIIEPNRKRNYHIFP